MADGLEVTLWAENPHLAKPIQINFDPQGRLWVASSEVYPQIEPGQAAHDKIIVLEDTKGAGKADKATVFADGLLIPTGVIPGDGGCYVAQSTELLHFKQTDPKKFVGDQKRIVLSSFGTEDTHHNLHTLRWGPDGRLWMSQSIYTRSEVETPHGVVRLRSGGIFRFEPAALKLEVVFKGWVNSWGHQFDEFGQSFMTDGAGGGGINWGLPGGMYVTYARARRILPSVSPGGYPKFASLEIIRSQHFPADWQGRLVTCDFRANRVTSFSITEQGAAYITKQETDICRTSNNTFRPIDVKLGPDGALYIADWSNPIINHGEVDFRDPRRDREHGRIWRVSVKGKAGAKNPALAQANTGALLNELLSPNHFNSSQATRLLVEKGSAAVAPELKTWTAKLKTEKEQLAALWIHQSLNIPAPELLTKLLGAQDGRIRAAAVRALSFATTAPAQPVRIADANGTASTYLSDANATFAPTDTVSRLAKLVTDPHPRVRLEAVRALGGDEFQPRLLRLFASIIPNDMSMVVRYARFSAPDYLVYEGISHHLIELYRASYYRFDPFYSYWQKRERGGVVSEEARPATEDEVADAVGAQPASPVDLAVRPRAQLVQPSERGLGQTQRPGPCQIRGRLPVEAGEPHDVLGREVRQR